MMAPALYLQNEKHKERHNGDFTVGTEIFNILLGYLGYVQRSTTRYEDIHLAFHASPL